MTQLREMLTSQQLSDLRKRGLISEQEFAYIAGDLLVAENVTSNEKRVVGESTLLTESNNKRLLKG
jgi:hypothetical protein